MFSLEELRRIEPTRPVVLEIHEKAVTNSSNMRELRSALMDLAIELAYDDFALAKHD